MFRNMNSQRQLALGLLFTCSLVRVASAQTQAPAPDAAAQTPAPPPPVEAPPPPPPPPPPPGKDAKYEFGKLEEVKKVEWKASASAGFSAATGNAQVLSFSGGGLVSRNDGKNKLQLAADALYTRTTQYTGFEDLNGNMKIDSDEPLTPESQETAASLKGGGRYDRFFSANNTGYLLFFAGFDKPASKDWFLGGQVGYMRQVVKTKMHELLAEAGYDFTFDYLLKADGAAASFRQDVSLHSARLFVGYGLSIGDHSSLRASVEALLNLVSLTIGDREVGAAEATRVNGKLEFTTKIWKPLSFRAAFNIRYNNAPAPFAKFATPIDHPNHYNQKLDTLTELGLVVNFI